MLTWSPGDVVKIEELLNAGVSEEVLTYISGFGDYKFLSGTNPRNYFIFTHSMHDVLEKMQTCWTVWALITRMPYDY